MREVTVSEKGKGSTIRRGDRIRLEFSVDVEYRADGDYGPYTGDEAEALKDVIDTAIAGFTSSAERTIRIDSHGFVRRLSEADRHPPRPR